MFSTRSNGKQCSVSAFSTSRKPIFWGGYFSCPNGTSYQRGTDADGESIAYFSANLPPIEILDMRINLFRIVLLRVLTSMHLLGKKILEVLKK